MRIRNLLAAITCTAGMTSFGMAAQTPISLTAGSFNENMIDGAGNGVVTASMDGGLVSAHGENQTYYEKGFASDSSGVRMGQTITSAVDPTTTYTFQSASATNNAAFLKFGDVDTTTLTLTSPGAYNTLSFLGDGSQDPLSYTINYQNGSTQTDSLPISAWWSQVTTNVAFDAEGRAASNGDSSTINQEGGPGNKMYQADIDVDNQAEQITSITLTVTDGGNPNGSSTAIFALSGDAVPEPASLAVLGVGSVMILARRRRA